MHRQLRMIVCIWHKAAGYLFHIQCKSPHDWPGVMITAIRRMHRISRHVVLIVGRQTGRPPAFQLLATQTPTAPRYPLSDYVKQCPVPSVLLIC